MLIGPPMTKYKMTLKAACAVSAWSPLPLPIKALAHWLSAQEVGLWTGVSPDCPLFSEPTGRGGGEELTSVES